MPNRSEPALAPPASAPDVPTPPPDAANPFAALGLREPLVRVLAEEGYEAPTPVQARAIPTLLQGHDLIGQAQTGTGKTAAFGLPLLQGLVRGGDAPSALVLAPTRELAMQVADALRTYARHLPRTRILTVYGGQPIHGQLQQLQRGTDVIVGTPGRVIDCLERGALDLSAVRLVVLDEADEMLRMGFLEDVERILAAAPDGRQTVLFSATMPDAIQRVARDRLHAPVHVEVAAEQRSVDGIEQRVLVTPQRQKVEVLARLLDGEASEAILVFAKTRLGCADLAEALDARGFPSAALHGDMTQSQREDVVRRLRAGRLRLVVATDVAARGLDVDCISHVVNHDPPMDAETYLHRIGRTGRAGRTGVAILLLTPRERWLRRTFERFSGREMIEVRPPRNAEIAARRAARLEERVAAEVAAGGLEPYRAVAERLAAERGIDPIDAAAALARLATMDGPLVVGGPELEEPEFAPPRRERSPGPPSRAPRGRGRDDAARMFLPRGTRDGLRPADLVGALTRGGGLPSGAIGTIDIRDAVTFFEVERAREEDVLAMSGRVELRGKPLKVARARPEGGGGRWSRSAPPGPPRGRSGRRPGPGR